jgi:hypothetical protein
MGPWASPALECFSWGIKRNTIEIRWRNNRNSPSELGEIVKKKYGGNTMEIDYASLREIG